MTRLQGTFERLRARGERALIPYFTAGDPSLALTAQLVAEAARQGADVIELGIPFSDPLADGPVIQRATQRALRAGVTLPRVLELVREIRGEVSVPLVFLTYYNPLLAFGLKAFCQTAVEVGVDGVIVADLPPEEAGPLQAEARPAGLDLIHLVAPTSPPARMRKIARASSGFIYMVSLTGVTGARTELPPDLLQRLRRLRGITTKPVCVGFGIGTPEQAAAVGRLADGVIVGSAIVRVVEEHAGSPALVAEVGRFIAALKRGVRSCNPTLPADDVGMQDLTP
ncbi:MAG: tryptophan synthase subunit alpha [Candidatus Rokubacteria bacterium GWC2_70_16]|nr:MAG: tryptophan synthase subunit alpha [Candidatus Rokubacteria bacterium GWC2_70_16]